MSQRFVNLGIHPIQVRDADGHGRTVRPFRELQAFHWRKEEDCVCEGAHYAKFPGLLSPFPDDADSDKPSAPAVAAKALPGRFKGTGDVLRPDGTVKKDVVDPTTAVPPAPSAPVDPVSEPVVKADDTADEDADDEVVGEDGEDIDEDRPLEDVPGVTPALAAALTTAGFTSALKLAECQSASRLKKLGKVKGVKNAGELADAAQTLLGWEEA